MTDIPDDLLALLHVTSREDGSPELDERTGQFALALFLLTDPQFQHGATAHVKVDDTIRAMQTFMVCLSLEKARRAGFLEVTYDADPFDHTGKVSMLPTTKLMPLVDAYRAGWRPPQPAAAGG